MKKTTALSFFSLCLAFAAMGCVEKTNDLTTAESNLVNQNVLYKRNVLTMQQRLGTLLQDRGLVIQ